MKKYSEIIEEMKQARAHLKDTAKTEKEMYRIALLETRKTGTPEEFEKARSQYKAAEARYIEECAHNENVKIALEILKDNAAQALFTETIATICEVWNKYEGKTHGEKTAQKIRDELKNATGYRVYIGNSYRDAKITVYFDCGSGAPFGDLEFIPIWNGEYQPALSENNKIVKLDPEKMRVYCGAEYVEDVSGHVKAIRKAHAATIEAGKAFEEAAEKYNKLTRGNIQRANTREGVKKWLI